MAKHTDRRLYRVIFQGQGRQFEVYARGVSQGSLFGFVEIEDLVFGEKSSLLVDPTEESLRKEFENTKRVYVPMHSIIRIDELEKDSALQPRVVALPEKSGDGSPRVVPFYTPGQPPTGE